MGPLAQFLLALTNLVRSGVIRNIPTAIKAAEREFGKVTPLLKKQIERIFEQAKKQISDKPGEKGRVIPFKKTEGIETLDKFNLSKDDPMGDLEKIVKGEGDTGLPSQFTDKEVDDAIDNVSPGFVSGDSKYNAELVAEELAESKGIDYDSLPPKDVAKIYGRAFDRLQKQRMQKEVDKTDELMDFFKKTADKELSKRTKDISKGDPTGKFRQFQEDIADLMEQLEKMDVRNLQKPGGPLDPVTGVTRTIARRILDKKGIKIGKKDPLEIFLNNFGVEPGTDIQNLGEQIVEAEKAGRDLKPLDDLIESEGFFDLEVKKDPEMGISNQEFLDMLRKDRKEKTMLEDFDIKDRKPNAQGGLTRTKFAMGSDDELPEDPTKPINPFGPKPTGPVLPDKMASYGYDDAMAETFEEFLRLKKIGEIPADMEFDEYMDLLDIDIPLGKKQKQAPSIKLALDDDEFYQNIFKIEDEALQRALKGFEYYRSMGGKLNFRDYLRNAARKGEQFRGAEGGLADIINL